MLTVLTWYWKQPHGRVEYLPLHVNIWADMVRAHLSMPHRICCVTDHPEGLDPRIGIITPPRDFEDITIPSWGPARPQCFRRLAMFAPHAAQTFGERICCMDLDVVISDSLDPLFATDADFKIYRGTAPGRPYNGSLMLFTAGARPQVYTRFTAAEAEKAGQKYIGSDQAWLAYVLGSGEATWTQDDGVVWWNRIRPARSRDGVRIMVFPGFQKPWQIANSGADAWTTSHYRRSPQGSCLILGYAPSVWDEAAEALERNSFDAVIASPEAAEHWPGDILAIADNDAHAMRLACMHGYDMGVFCGQTKADMAFVERKIQMTINASVH